MKKLPILPGKSDNNNTTDQLRSVFFKYPYICPICFVWLIGVFDKVLGKSSQNYDK